MPGKTRTPAAADGRGPRRTALVTGASAGIGEAIAGCLAREGFRLVLVARSAGKLEGLAAELRGTCGVAVEVIPTDLAAPGAVAALAAALARKRRTIDLLVNNAGTLEQGGFTVIAAARHRAIVELNVAVPTAMLAAFVPAMVRRGWGRVLNVASIGAFQPVPGLATYAASKAYLLSLSEALGEELAGTGVTVTALCPGITATAMLGGAKAHNPKLARLPGFVVGDVAEVAEAGVRGCLRGEAVVVPGAVNQAAVLAAGSTPKWLLRKVAGVVGRKMI